jgi:predicted Zn-dependent protease
MSGSKYPEFEMAGGTAQIHISYVNGSESSPHCNGNTIYCSSTYNPTTHDIILYENTAPTRTTGSTLSNQTTGQIQTLLAHELGHALGIDDDTCNNGLMNQNIPASPASLPRSAPPRSEHPRPLQRNQQ